MDIANKAVTKVSEHIQGIIKTGRLNDEELKELEDASSQLNALIIAKAKELNRKTKPAVLSDARIEATRSDYERMAEATEEKATKIANAMHQRDLKSFSELFGTTPEELDKRSSEAIKTKLEIANSLRGRKAKKESVIEPNVISEEQEQK